jgi:predicted PurR-regulated permease PerM
MKHDNPYTKPETYFVLVVLVIVGILSFLVFMPFIATLILAATFAVVVYPLHKKVLKLFRGNNLIGSFATLLILIVVVIVPLFLIAAKVFTEATSAYHHISSSDTNLSMMVDTFQNKINTSLEQITPGVTIDIRNYFDTGTAWIFKNIGSFFSGTLGVGLNIFLCIFALFYFIKDGKNFLEFFKNISPLPDEHTDVLINKLRAAVKSIIGGSIVVAICQGIASGIGYSIFGLPNPALWGTITGLAALVPGFGTSIIMVPVIIFLFVTAPLWQGIGLTIWWLFGVGLIDNFLSPKLIGGGLNIHPLIILFSIIGGLAFFGPEGFLLGPLTMSLFFSLFDIYHLITRPPSMKAREEVINEEEIINHEDIHA